MDKIDRAVQCIHVYISPRTGYNQVLVRPDGWADGWVHDLPPVWKVETVSRSILNDTSPARWNGPRHPTAPKHVSEISRRIQGTRARPE